MGSASSALILASLAIAGCGGERIVVASKNFTESAILGELVAQQIERRTDLAVDRRFFLGGTFVCHNGIVSGKIDVYVEYTGTALTAILELPTVFDRAAAYRRVRDEYDERFHVAWGRPLGFNNTFAILVREADARALGIETISEAAAYTQDWTAGFGYEFVEREDGYVGLAEIYGFRFRNAPRTMDLGLTYRALAAGQVDMIAGNSTDGLIEALDLFQLEDDRSYFPPYEAAPLIRNETLARHPEVGEALDALGGLISDDEMRKLNYMVDVEHQDAAAVVRRWLDAKLPLTTTG